MGGDFQRYSSPMQKDLRLPCLLPYRAADITPYAIGMYNNTFWNLNFRTTSLTLLDWAPHLDSPGLASA